MPWSTFFAPWNAGATVLMVNPGPPFNAKGPAGRAGALQGSRPSCAPPTVWRLLIQEDLRRPNCPLREVCGRASRSNPRYQQGAEGWAPTSATVYGQTETTAQIANPPGPASQAGSMGPAVPGYRVLLLDYRRQGAKEAKVCPRPRQGSAAGLMQANADGAGKARRRRRRGLSHRRCSPSR